MSASLGRTLIKTKAQKARENRSTYATLIRAAAVEGERAPSKQEGKKLKSIWETTNMEEFLTIADEREKGYTAERNTRIVVGGAVHILQNSKVVPYTDNRDWLSLSAKLPIPRRPQWSFKMRPDELERAEKTMFIEWRRGLSQMEEANKVLLTPYEKNLEVWRQLWRVVERSDVVLEIVDARNPLAFRSMDFERYVAEHKRATGVAKECILLVNKADLLTENQRRAWANYFIENKIRFFFFAALPLEDPKAKAGAFDDDDADAPPKIGAELEAELEAAAEDDSDSDGDSDAGGAAAGALDTSDEDSALHSRARNNQKRVSRRLKGQPLHVDPRKLALHNEQFKEQQVKPKERKAPPPTATELERDARLKTLAAPEPWAVLSPLQLVDQLALMRAPLGINDPQMPINVGMVGYPNVGKSSTINSIMGCHKVVVSATPGKTKHFQTLLLPEERRVVVCDCPGLVFPSFAATRETMICDGILPVDTVKDYTTPVEVICHRIPQHVLEFAYATALSPEDDIDDSTSVAERVLNLIARRKGYMTDHDKPNRSKVAKEILKHYVDGRLVYVHPPPNFTFDPEVVAAATAAAKAASAPAAASTSGPRAAKEAAADGDAEGEGEGKEDDEDSAGSEAWEDISSADEARALSDDGGDARGGGGEHDEDDEDDDGPVPKFMARQRGGDLTQAELFNYERNTRVLEDKKRRGKKKKINHQIEPESVAVRITEDGDAEIMVDSDDGIIEHYGPGVEARARKDKVQHKSKRAMRRELRREGLHVPQNRTTKVVAIKGL